VTAVPATAQAAPPRKTVVVMALGITQILAWGSTFYLLGVLAPFIARDTGWSYDFIIGGVSLGLLIAGLVSPLVGRLIGRRGGKPVFAVSAVLLAAGLFGLGMAPNIAAYLAAWIVIGRAWELVCMMQHSPRPEAFTDRDLAMWSPASRYSEVSLESPAARSH
jgi:MFS family permease